MDKYSVMLSFIDTILRCWRTQQIGSAKAVNMIINVILKEQGEIK
jgi:hypothetical protein